MLAQKKIMHTMQFILPPAYLPTTVMFQWVPNPKGNACYRARPFGKNLGWRKFTQGLNHTIQYFVYNRMHGSHGPVYPASEARRSWGFHPCVCGRRLRPVVYTSTGQAVYVYTRGSILLLVKGNASEGPCQQSLEKLAEG